MLSSVCKTGASRAQAHNAGAPSHFEILWSGIMLAVLSGIPPMATVCYQNYRLTADLLGGPVVQSGIELLASLSCSLTVGRQRNLRKYLSSSRGSHMQVAIGPKPAVQGLADEHPSSSGYTAGTRHACPRFQEEHSKASSNFNFTRSRIILLRHQEHQMQYQGATPVYLWPLSSTAP